MRTPVPAKIVVAIFFLWLSALSYLAWFEPGRLVPPLWRWPNSGYALWITRLLAPIGVIMTLIILVA
jgi:hypothetical protein